MSVESKTVGAFLSAVASENVTPAGGTCAAVVGAIGASLCEMACIHTLRAEGSPGVESALVEASDDLATQRERLLGLGDSDARVVEGLPEAFEDDQDGVKRATGVPLTIAETCLHVLESAAVVTREANPNVRPDARSGVLFVDAALRASVSTVRTNTDVIDDPAFVEQMNRRTAEIESSAAETFDEMGSDPRR